MRLGCGMFLCSFVVLCCVCVTNGCDEITKPYGAVTAVYGKMLGPGDYFWSVVTCPRGTVVVYCTCSNYNQCDGKRVPIRRCIAAIQAVAFCGNGNSSDYEVVTQFPKVRSTATCSPGFKVLACGVKNPQSHMYCCYPEISENGTGCGMREDSRKGGACWTYAICERIENE